MGTRSFRLSEFCNRASSLLAFPQSPAIWSNRLPIVVFSNSSAPPFFLHHVPSTGDKHMLSIQTTAVPFPQIPYIPVTFHAVTVHLLAFSLCRSLLNPAFLLRVLGSSGRSVLILFFLSLLGTPISQGITRSRFSLLLCFLFHDYSFFSFLFRK